ncbi:two-component system sensor histidine kinase PilS (NtrC family) [Plasticicumulans lactativorans]|uniref:histidine kinase n=1 Tax=Plasticicumulans lactativorans TaxID=1133106 RepID=A0A4R2L3D2_9GAMM|nr:ATP-binding protein [Plasticicumulans lactativorans]TCO80202.1 two-component system sensor histidine kinase PilS (NtrC family) [Plasticicumulans lactativorans]
MSSHQPSLAGILPGTVADRRHGWSVFRAYNLYRLALAALLLGICAAGEQGRILGAVRPELFWWVALVYFWIVALTLGLSYARRPPLLIQASAQGAVDAICLGLLLYASAGDASIGALLVTAAAGSAILLPPRPLIGVVALACAAASLAWLAHLWTVFSQRTGAPRFGTEYLVPLVQFASGSGFESSRPALLCLLLAAAAAIAYHLAERTRRSEHLVLERTFELLEMAELNATILKHLQSGIVVVDRHSHVRMMNQTAAQLLDVQGPAEGRPLAELSPVLGERLAAWVGAEGSTPRPFRQAEHLPEIIPEFSHLPASRAFDTLVFLEDSSAAAQRLQQIKLAALGRLTASIAHEIRNPLASISHAAQLLSESSVGPTEKRLGRIIFENAGRANRIIANVLDLSRREAARPETLLLKPWLEEFAREFSRGRGAPLPTITITVEPASLAVRFDASHLQQVLWNLCSNACEHGSEPGRAARIRLTAAVDAERRRPFLDVQDSGLGIPEAEARQIFEPFFTTNPRGTGLGLYISRELCEANRAQLQYLRPSGGGSCFRVTFPATGRNEDAPWTLARH